MRILVLGARGTLGRHLVNELRSRGHNLYQADKDHSDLENYQRCDISQFRQIERTIALADPEMVYNLAAEFGRWNGEAYYESVWATNAIGLKHILKLQEERKFKLVHFSSSEVYGDFDGVMREDVMDTHEVRQLNDYALSKWVNEIQIMNSASMTGTESVRVRLFNTYGPGEHYTPFRSAICLFAYRALHDIPYTVYVDHRRTSTYVTDCCVTLANIADNFIPGEVYNIGGNELHDMKTISSFVLAATGKGEQLVTYKQSEPFTTKDKLVDVSKAVRDLDLTQTVSLEEGIGLTVNWMKSVYNK